MWDGYLYIVMVFIKNMDCNEWFVEKVIEIGFDELIFLNCCFFEWKVIKIECIEKILVFVIK